MTDATDRRRFLQSTAALAALTAFRPQLSQAMGLREPKTAIPLSMLPAERTLFDRFRLAADAGFSGIEMRTVVDPAEAGKVREAAERAGLSIHTVVNMAERSGSLGSPDPDEVRQAVARLETSLRNARLWEADAVLLAPAAAGPKMPYREAWHRSSTVIRERVLPLARELDIVLAVEEVWDGFLLGPHELARYVDAFASPWVKASLDTDRIVFYTHPQDWIRALGSRLVMVRMRSLSLGGEGGVLRSPSIRDEDEWEQTRSALKEISYDGWVTAETAGNEGASFRELAPALRRYLGG
jgi:hexulose-6-phosphate isomerase